MGWLGKLQKLIQLGILQMPSHSFVYQNHIEKMVKRLLLELAIEDHTLKKFL